jgi:hypothetical protein
VSSPERSAEESSGNSAKSHHKRLVVGRTICLAAMHFEFLLVGTSVIKFFGHELVLVSTPGITVLTCTDRSVPIGGEDLIELGGIC